MKSLMAGAAALAVLVAAGAANAATYMYALRRTSATVTTARWVVTGIRRICTSSIDLGSDKLMDSGAHELISGLPGAAGSI